MRISNSSGGSRVPHSRPNPRAASNQRGKADARRREEKSLLPQILTRDPAALDALFGSLRGRLTAVAQRFTRDPESAEDVVQNAFEKVLRNRDQFRGDAQVSTWIHRIVVNEALMWLRSERRRCVRIEDDHNRSEIADPRRNAVEELIERERAQRLRDGLASLEPLHRDILQRCAIDGVSYRQLSRETGFHPAALKSRAFRARRTLSRRFAED